MNKKEFYQGFIGTETQALSTGGTVSVPKSLSNKASIILESLRNASIGWDYTLAQLQEKVWEARAEKCSWTNSGKFKASDVLTVKDIREAMLQVFFNGQASECWTGTMLMLIALKNGEFVLRKVEYVPEFFKAKDEGEKAEKKYTLADDLDALLEKRGLIYSDEDKERLLNAIELLAKGDLDKKVQAPKAVLFKKRA